MGKNLALGSLLAATMFLAHPALAQDAAEKSLKERFRQLDKNGDGKISTEELPQSPFFKQRDKNGDGAITLAEAMEFLASDATPDTAPAPAKPPPRAGKGRGPAPAASLRQGPQPLRPGDHGVGRRVADASFTDLAGETQQLSRFARERAIVVAMTSTSCPLSQKYLPTLAKLAQSYSKREVTWILVNPQATDKIAEMKSAAKSLGGKAIYVPDPDRSLARAVGALTTTDVIVLDASRTVVYHGAIDDQYGQGYAIDAPRHRYLADALEALLAGRQPHVAATSAPGCVLDLPPKPGADLSLTYHNRISRIVQAHCVECHRDGGVAPFSLTTYEDVAAHAPMIKQVVEQGIMPPWFAAPPDEAPEQTRGAARDQQPSLWANDRSLAESDKTDLLAWIAGGKALGDAADAHQPRSFASGWLIGKPDAVFAFSEAVPIKASGIIPYQSVLIDTNLAEDKWVQAIEVQPGDRTVVHHMLIYIQPAGRKQSSRIDDLLDEVGGFWGVYVPGNSTLIYPPGFAKRLPKGCRLRCQVHYTTNGTETSDRSRIGVIYAKEPPQHEVHVVGLANLRLSIPPGASNHREEAILRAPCDMQLLSLLPHMHARATACRYRITDADDKSRALLDIPRYDFNWQLLYRYFEPQPVARGEMIKFTVWYDNSNRNPANPDSTQTVHWGRQLSDEMHLGYVEYFIPGLKPGEEMQSGVGQR
ncbi:MAG: redoxin family protein [Planctomycetaceae bacterium]|nr:redoxin family protein [Planctomycetaceae bacterium]